MGIPSGDQWSQNDPNSENEQFAAFLMMTAFMMPSGGRGELPRPGNAAYPGRWRGSSASSFHRTWPVPTQNAVVQTVEEQAPAFTSWESAFQQMMPELRSKYNAHVAARNGALPAQNEMSAEAAATRAKFDAGIQELVDQAVAQLKALPRRDRDVADLGPSIPRSAAGFVSSRVAPAANDETPILGPGTPRGSISSGLPLEAALGDNEVSRMAGEMAEKIMTDAFLNFS